MNTILKYSSFVAVQTNDVMQMHTKLTLLYYADFLSLAIRLFSVFGDYQSKNP